MKNIYLISLALVLSSCSTSTAISEIPVFKILKPTGPYKVGTSHYNFIDKKRIDPYTPGKKHRALPVQVWYPAVVSEEDKLAAYEKKEVIKLLKKIIAEANELPLSRLKNLDSLKSNSYLNAKVSNQQTKFPVLIFSPGQRMSIRSYTSLTEELASHGYVVFGTTHPYNLSDDSSPPIDEEEHSVWADDLKYILDQIFILNQKESSKIFTGKLDLSSLGVVGHSFGGGTLAHLCSLDSRCKSAVSLDSTLYASKNPDRLHKPTMFLKGTDYGVPDNEEIKVKRKIKNDELTLLLKNSKKEAPMYQYYIEGADHWSFSDQWLIDRFLVREEDSISPERGIEITRKLLLWFFDKQTKGKEQQKFPDAKQYPEIKNILK